MRSVVVSGFLRRKALNLMLAVAPESEGCSMGSVPVSPLRLIAEGVLNKSRVFSVREFTAGASLRTSSDPGNFFF